MNHFVRFIVRIGIFFGYLFFFWIFVFFGGMGMEIFGYLGMVLGMSMVIFGYLGLVWFLVNTQNQTQTQAKY